MTTARLKRPLGAGQSPQPIPGSFKPFIATPCYGGQLLASYAAGMEHLVASLAVSGIEYRKERLGNESLITRARNRLVAMFLQTDCTHLLFIDADVGFTGADVQSLVLGDFDVCCGAYPMKAYSWETIATAAKAGCPASDLPKAGAMYAANATFDAMGSMSVDVIKRGDRSYIEVMDGATGFMLIRRSVIERYIWTYRKDIEYTCDYDPDKGKVHHAVFQAARDPYPPNGGLGRYLSEDYYFCRMVQRMGIKIYLSLDAKLTHTGTHTFRGDVSMLLEPEEAVKETDGIEMVDTEGDAREPSATAVGT